MKKILYLILMILLCQLNNISAYPSQQDIDREIDEFDREVAQLKSIFKPIDISIDVVGFDIQKGSTEETQLSAVASEGAGNYYPVEKAEDLAKVFTNVTTGVGTVGGGGGPVIATPKTNWTLIFVIGFAAGSILLVFAIIAVRRRSETEPLKLYARLDITYSDGGTKTFEIRKPRTSIGRSPDNSLVINDSAASSQQSEIIASQAGFLLRDLGSMNGTNLNGKMISESYLYLEDVITIGSTKLIFRG